MALVAVSSRPVVIAATATELVQRLGIKAARAGFGIHETVGTEVADFGEARIFPCVAGGGPLLFSTLLPVLGRLFVPSTYVSLNELIGHGSGYRGQIIALAGIWPLVCKMRAIHVPLGPKNWICLFPIP